MSYEEECDRIYAVLSEFIDEVVNGVEWPCGVESVEVEISAEEFRNELWFIIYATDPRKFVDRDMFSYISELVIEYYPTLRENYVWVDVLVSCAGCPELDECEEIKSEGSICKYKEMPSM